ncbi:hypothetical protein [Hyphomicrobium sp. DY-1]|uniref:hypothetical protein n=1 Tax=Hyphomicrobium sp. DY-1 TaxID=3075650 RepID=UPI0039C30208
MTEDDIRAEAHRLISGHGDFPAIAFPHDPWAMDAVVKWTRMFLEKAGETASHLHLALFIRKLAIHIVRTGKAHYFFTHYAMGSAYFARNPHTLETKLTFGGAMKREFDSTSARFRKIDGPERDTTRTDLKSRLTPKPLLMVHGDYTLHQLAHAQHVLEAGMLADNCLIHEVRNTILPNPAYWIPIKNGTRLLFALSHRDRLSLLISVVDGVVTEEEFLDDAHDLQFVMPAVITTLHGLLGVLWPSRASMVWPIPPEPPLPLPPNPNQLHFSFWGSAP